MLRIVIFILICLCLPACATVNHGASDHFRIDSAPQGAKVVTTLETRDSKRRRAGNPKLKKEFIGCEPTPCSIKLSRHSRFIAAIEHPGYERAEIFIDSTSKQGSFAGSMAMTTATVTGGAVLGAATAAALSAFAAQIGAAMVSVTLNVASYGLINVPVSSVTVATTSTSSAAAAAVPPALAVTGGMLLIDAASGANKNLFPNPVVLGLAPDGAEVIIDPFVVLFRKELDAQDNVDLICDTNSGKECRTARALLADAVDNRREFQKVFYAALKADAKAAREAEFQAKKEVRE